MKNVFAISIGEPIREVIVKPTTIPIPGPLQLPAPVPVEVPA